MGPPNANHMMPLLVARAILVSALAISSASTASQPVTPVGPSFLDMGKPLIDWVRRLAGERATSCGAHLYSRDRSKSASCAQRAAATSTAFWIAFEDVGLDSGGWHGFARNSKGQMWEVSYDFGSSMKNMERPPSIVVYSCKRLYVAGERVACDAF